MDEGVSYCLGKSSNLRQYSLDIDRFVDLVSQGVNDIPIIAIKFLDYSVSQTDNVWHQKLSATLDNLVVVINADGRRCAGADQESDALATL